MTEAAAPTLLGADAPARLPARFARLGLGYFRARSGAAALLLLAGILACVVLQVVVQLRINIWQRDFFDALERRAIDAFVHEIGVFALLAAGSVLAAVLQLDQKMRLQLGWRRWIATRLIGAWLHDGRQYALGFVEGAHDNPDQRIAEDVRLATEIVVDFCAGLASALLMFACFVGVLWTLSSSLTLPVLGGITIPGYMVWAALLYAVVGTALTSWMGAPLARLSATRHAEEANYRFHLVRARENAEGIALTRGEADERDVLDRSFAELARAWRALRRGTCRLAWLTSGYSLTGIIFPVLVAAPMYLTGEITLGVLMQAVAAMVHVQTALSWFVDNYPRIADWRASAGRVVDLAAALDDVSLDAAAPAAERIALGDGAGGRLILHDLQIAFPDGKVVMAGVTATIEPGEKVLIVGESGTGKSTLMRAIAGVWPWGRGRIELPRDARIMFMPQRPYLPLGELAAALAYPLAAEVFPDDAYEAVLQRCGLGALVPRLHERERWDQILSGGEQQRLAFARLLLQQPEWVFLDEATSALDEDGQAALMRLFHEELAATAVISIGHRPGLEKLHERVMTLLRGDPTARLVRGSRRPGRRPAVGQPRRLHRAMLERLRRLVSNAARRRAAPDAPE